MKIEVPKHNHKLTDLLKVCIFSLLMLAPLVASCSQWIYATINKNAYQSYSGTQTINTYSVVNDASYHTNVPQNIQEIRIDNYYEINNNNFENLAIQFEPIRQKLNTLYNGEALYLFFEILDFNYEDFSSDFVVDDNYVDEYSEFYRNTTLQITIADDVYFYIINCSYVYSFNDINYYHYTYYMLDTFNTVDVSFNLKFINIDVNNVVDTTLLTFDYQEYPLTNATFEVPIYLYETIESTTLDNAFYYGVDQMTKSELFNWTENTALYSGIKAMTDNLQIQTNAIAILLTYWFILTIIYIIVDIVLKLFTTITHLGTKD